VQQGHSRPVERPGACLTLAVLSAAAAWLVYRASRHPDWSGLVLLAWLFGFCALDALRRTWIAHRLHEEAESRTRRAQEASGVFGRSELASVKDWLDAEARCRKF
jgi:hypothetical protein